MLENKEKSFHNFEPKPKLPSAVLKAGFNPSFYSVSKLIHVFASKVNEFSLVCLFHARCSLQILRGLQIRICDKLH